MANGDCSAIKFNYKILTEMYTCTVNQTEWSPSIKILVLKILTANKATKVKKRRSIEIYIILLAQNFSKH